METECLVGVCRNANDLKSNRTLIDFWNAFVNLPQI
jgi:hypothetical protein